MALISTPSRRRATTVFALTRSRNDRHTHSTFSIGFHNGTSELCVCNQKHRALSAEVQRPLISLDGVYNRSGTNPFDLNGYTIQDNKFRGVFGPFQLELFVIAPLVVRAAWRDDA